MCGRARARAGAAGRARGGGRSRPERVPGAGISLGGGPAPGGRISDPLRSVLKPRSERSRLLGSVPVRHILRRDFVRLQLDPGRS